MSVTGGRTREESRRVGKALRKQVPRSSHADWAPSADRPDPIGLLEAQNVDADESLEIAFGKILDELCCPQCLIPVEQTPEGLVGIGSIELVVQPIEIIDSAHEASHRNRVGENPRGLDHQAVVPIGDRFEIS